MFDPVICAAISQQEMPIVSVESLQRLRVLLPQIAVSLDMTGTRSQSYSLNSKGETDATQRPSRQLDIFHRHQPEPSWQTIPESTRQKVTKLMEVLFREHQQKLLGVTEQNQEVGDE